ncbi:MAG: VWA domain-containing protein [Rhodobacteraceae bacterium]|nr:VWA domain-containing protein [Paracoccaceae bacterium]
MSASTTSCPEGGALVRNVTQFARALRRGGLQVGPGQVVDAIRAVTAAGFSSREDFYWILHACFVVRGEDRQVFAQTFRLFWRDPRILERLMSLLLPSVRGVQREQQADAAARRAAEALLDKFEPGAPAQESSGHEFGLAVNSEGTAASSERLRHLDFEQMSNAELTEARKIIAELRIPVRPMVSRRRRVHPRGPYPDWRSTMRQAAARGGEINELALQGRQQRWPGLVALCDISGSMAAYSRNILRFLHALSHREGSGWSRVHAFTFGTRLTNISRHLRIQDIDAALAAAGSDSPDWEGGTRIGQCLGAFNRDWSGRIMGSGAYTLLITDGLDGGEAGELAREARFLRLRSRRLIWINPLLRWQGFLPKARGIREMLPHVDCFRSAHNITSLADLAKALGQTGDAGEKPRLLAALRSEG